MERWVRYAYPKVKEYYETKRNKVLCDFLKWLEATVYVTQIQ